MIIHVNVPDYTPATGLKNNWESGFEISVKKQIDAICISANRAGLMSLANFFLTLAQENVPPGCHMHLDEYGGLEEGSIELIIVKVP